MCIGIYWCAFMSSVPVVLNLVPLKTVTLEIQKSSLRSQMLGGGSIWSGFKLLQLRCISHPDDKDVAQISLPMEWLFS